jgi:hypothetical protein
MKKHLTEPLQSRTRSDPRTQRFVPELRCWCSSNKLGRYSSLADSGHGVQFNLDVDYELCNLNYTPTTSGVREQKSRIPLIQSMQLSESGHSHQLIALAWT